MLKKLLSGIFAAGILLSGAAAFALTMDEAKANIDKQASAKKLGAGDHSQAVATLQGLVDKGVPIEHAYRVVEASINQGIKGKELAGIAKSIEAAGPAARKDAATVATDAIQHKYSGRETAQLTNTFGKTVASGAPADKTSQVMTTGIGKGLGENRVIAATNRFAGDIKSGMAPDKAAENATRTMDRDRTMQQDRDMTRDRMGDRQGMGPGSGMGSGMGGPRR